MKQSTYLDQKILYPTANQVIYAGVRLAGEVASHKSGVFRRLAKLIPGYASKPSVRVFQACRYVFQD